MKTFPKVGDQGYLRQFTGSYYVDLVKLPYTVIEVNKNEVIVQAAKRIYPVFHYDPETMSDYYKQFDNRQVCFYDTVAESIEPNPFGKIERLTWHPKRERWGTPGPDSEYPEYLITDEGYVDMPYLD